MADMSGENGVSSNRHETLASCKNECAELEGCVAIDYIRNQKSVSNCYAYFRYGTRDTNLVPNKTTDHYVFSKCPTGKISFYRSATCSIVYFEFTTPL